MNRAIALAGPREKLALYLGSVCGLRIGEALAVNDGCLSGNRLKISARVNSVGLVDGLKHGAKARSVTVNINELNKLLRALPDRKSEFWIESSRGKRFSRNHYRSGI